MGPTHRSTRTTLTPNALMVASSGVTYMDSPTYHVTKYVTWKGPTWRVRVVEAPASFLLPNPSPDGVR
eukprot:97563-Pyramimonas_sp.AAC.1